MMDAREAWLRLALTPGLSARAVEKAVQAAGDPVVACRWPVERLARAGGCPRPGGPACRPVDVALEPVLRRAEALGARALTPVDEDWPRTAFQGMVDPPAALFVAGRLPAPAQPCVSIVGTRRATPYGARVARDLAEKLVRRGVCVVSGLASGVDAAAHAGALAALPGGNLAAPPPTLAVLGHGLAHSYPPENALLREQVVAAGGCVTEYAPDVPPDRWRFPARNRLVAAFARVLVVVEAPLQSGAMDSAGHAVEQHRHVLAVPGPIDRLTHEGCHRLLADKMADVCRGVRDVLLALGLDPASTTDAGPAAPVLPPPPPGPQLALWSLLDRDEACDADELCLRSALPASDVAAALASLELSGRVVRIPGLGYRRA